MYFLRIWHKFKQNQSIPVAHLKYPWTHTNTARNFRRARTRTWEQHGRGLGWLRFGHTQLLQYGILVPQQYNTNRVCKANSSTIRDLVECLVPFPLLGQQCLDVGEDPWEGLGLVCLPEIINAATQLALNLIVHVTVFFPRTLHPCLHLLLARFHVPLRTCMESIEVTQVGGNHVHKYVRAYFLGMHVCVPVVRQRM